jgi:DNA-binding transcriptional regulator LsrR (DeoR family)
MVKITIESPLRQLTDIEHRLKEATGLHNAVVTPTVPGHPDTNLQQVGRAAANELLTSIRDGDVIAITGGKAVSAIVAALPQDRRFDVTVVPLTGGVQGKYYTDVNHLATQLAARLGGSAMLLHAPLFAESRAQRNTLMKVGSIREVLDLARRAQVALVGIGSIRAPDSSYYDLVPDRGAERELIGSGATGEFLAHLIRDDGSVADVPLNSRLVALRPAELSSCPKVIGVSAGPEKVQPIRAALAGGLINSLVIDEETASSVLEAFGEVRHPGRPGRGGNHGA